MRVEYLAFQVADPVVVAASRGTWCSRSMTAGRRPNPMPSGDVFAMLRDPFGLPIQLVHRGRPFIGPS